jgi:hypothetical protein
MAWFVLPSAHPESVGRMTMTGGARLCQPSELAPGALHPMTGLFELFDNTVTMVALHFNHAILDRSTRAAGRAQLFAQRGQGNGVERQPSHDRYALPAPTFGLASYPRDAVAYRLCPRNRLAYTFRERASAFGTHPSTVCGVNEATLRTALPDRHTQRHKGQRSASLAGCVCSLTALYFLLNVWLGHKQTMHFGARTSAIVCIADRRRAERSGIAPSRRQSHASGRTVAHESSGLIVSERKGTGLTFGRWRQEMHLISPITRVHQGAPITQVALSSGYESHNTHPVAVKNHFGISASGFWRSAQRREQ